MTRRGRPGDETDPDLKQTGEHICPKCAGKGKIDGRPCPDCAGTGKIIAIVGDA